MADTELRTTDMTRIALPFPLAVAFTAVGAALGAVLGWFLPALLHVLGGFPWIPVQGALTLLGQLVAAVPHGLLPVLGGVLGTFAGLALVSSTTTITVSASEIVVKEGSKRRRWARAQVDAAVVEAGHLSLRDARDVDLTRESIDGDATALTDALRRHGWPVRQGS